LLPANLLAQLRSVVGDDHVRVDDESRTSYGVDALKRGRQADAVVLPASTADVAAIVRACAA
jgi:FAD/FMN-containing dehydrogenase